jgi:hypothetical protein
MENNEKIFIQIASYRDPQLLPTLYDCIKKAKYPDNLTFSIAWQHSAEDEWDRLDDFVNDGRFKIIDINHVDSKGACWARNITQKYWNGEKFSLQLDSHMRFIQNWDEQIITIWKSLNDDKAIITGYPPNFTPDMPEESWYNVPQICNIYGFNYKYPLNRPMNMAGWENKTKPVRGVHISAGFIFSTGETNETVPYDPEFYFSGEETAMAIRYFTNGYNIYNSHRVIVYHYYQRMGNKKHWEDHQNWGHYNAVSHERLDCLLGRNEKYSLGIYGLGTKRTLEDYKNYAGVDFVNHIVHKETELGIEPPCSNSEIGWDNEKITFNSPLAWDYEKIEKVDDIRFWAMIVLDQYGVAIHREDIIYDNENKDIFNGTINSRTFIFERSKNRQVPTQLMIWPFSNGSGWRTATHFKI